MLSPRDLLLPGLLLLSACESASFAPPPTPTPASPPTPTPVDPGALPRAAYDPARDGFVVHEWGTLTSVRGSDGSLLPGLHHEEEDLPAFVADRLAQAAADPSVVLDPTRQKMETPVTYFYSPGPRTVSARVSFPQGLLTQWYPFVRAMTPPVFTISGALADRHLQTLESIPAPCQVSFRQPLQGGLLDWGQVEVMAPAQSAPLPGPTGATTWTFARNTAANPLRVTSAAGEQYERFLFYRGLGDFELPLQVRFAGDEPVFQGEGGTLGGLFLMVVTAEGAGFRELGDLPAGQARQAPLPAPSMAHGPFVSALKARLAARLVEDGLYSDEAVAMVDTWERAYFLTPGVRLLYLLPQAHTDRLLPLTLSPAPARLVRTMVVRTELLTPTVERELGGWLAQLADAGGRAEARTRFLALRRFAEPLLSRAVSRSSDAAERAAGEALLTEVRLQRRWAPLAAE